MTYLDLSNFCRSDAFPYNGQPIEPNSFRTHIGQITNASLVPQDVSEDFKSDAGLSILEVTVTITDKESLFFNESMVLQYWDQRTIIDLYKRFGVVSETSAGGCRDLIKKHAYVAQDAVGKRNRFFALAPYSAPIASGNI